MWTVGNYGLTRDRKRNKAWCRKQFCPRLVCFLLLQQQSRSLGPLSRAITCLSDGTMVPSCVENKVSIPGNSKISAT